MPRRGRLLVLALLTSLALGAAACASPVDPVAACDGGAQNSGTCFNASGAQNSGT